MWNNSQHPTPLDFSFLHDFEDELLFERTNSLSLNYMDYDPLDCDIGPIYFPSHLLPQEVVFEAAPYTLSSSNIRSHITTNNTYTFDQEMKSMEEIQVKNITKTSLSREEISKYFYMPIKVAAKELNVGLSLLKRRCRELGIKRWPHRKLKSLQILINNVEAMREKENNGKKVKEVIEELAYEQRLMEEMPDLQLKDQTKRLRQACFKGNYKWRKKLMMMCKEEDEVST